MNKLSERTYQSWINVYLRNLNGQEPSRENAAGFLSQMGAKGYRQNTLAVIRNALRWKFGFDLPSISIEIGEPKYISVDDVRRMIDAAPTLLEKTVIILLFSTACRISEILNLNKKDIEWDHGVITVTRKGGRRQRVKVDDKGMRALKEWVSKRESRDSRVFMDYTYGDVYYAIKKLGSKLGIKVTPHTFRHSRIIQLMRSGIEIHTVSSIAGHRKLDTTLQMYGTERAEDLGKYLEQAEW